MVRKADPAFLSFKKRVLTRDNHTCQYCGFKADEFLDVVNIDGNYKNNRTTNLATACCFCSQCFFLEAIGKSDFGGGSLIYLPEMTQGELNALCHVLFAAMIGSTSYATQAKNIYRSLKLRSQQVEKELGEGMSNPSLYGHLLIEVHSSPDKIAALHKDVSAKVRVLPNMARFSEQVKVWAKAGIEALQSYS